MTQLAANRETCFYEALEELERGFNEKLKAFLSLPGSSVDFQSQQGKTFLQTAARAGNLEDVQFLLDCGAGVDVKDRRGKHALSIASSAGHIDVIKLLIKAGSELNLRDKFGRSALHWATMTGHGDVLQELISAGADVVCKGNWHPLHEACKAGNTEFVKILMKAGAVVNNPENSPWPSPLYIACRQGHLDCVKFLIEHGADVNSVNAAGHTPLHEASFRGHADIVLELLNHGANPNAENNQERTPLHDACMQGKIKCIIMLLDCKSNVSAQDLMYKTPLMLTLRANHPQDILNSIVTILLQYGANPSVVQGIDSETALEIALSLGQNEVWDIFQRFLDEPRKLMQICKVVIRKHIFWCEEKVDELCLPHTMTRYIKQDLVW